MTNVEPNKSPSFFEKTAKKVALFEVFKLNTKTKINKKINSIMDETMKGTSEKKADRSLLLDVMFGPIFAYGDLITRKNLNKKNGN